MNKRTRAIDKEAYKLIISTMKSGFKDAGENYKPNVRIATVLVIEYNLGLRVGEILNLTMESFVKDTIRYRLDIHEQKLESTEISQYLLKFIVSFVIMLMRMVLIPKRSFFQLQSEQY